VPLISTTSYPDLIELELASGSAAAQDKQKVEVVPQIGQSNRAEPVAVVRVFSLTLRSCCRQGRAVEGASGKDKPRKVRASSLFFDARHGIKLWRSASHAACVRL
jgi:hypothetical protein